MVIRLALFLAIGALLTKTIPAIADNHGSVRMYKLNSKDQLIKRRWVKKSDLPGCHDLRGKKKAHRFAQVGFSWCTVYAAGDCLAGSEIAAMWRGNSYRTADIDISQPQLKLLPGANWYLHESENIQIGSWTCEY
jgi:hypothetical protein